jgi:hypothetical protein
VDQLLRWSNHSTSTRVLAAVPITVQDTAFQCGGTKTVGANPPADAADRHPNFER